MALFLTSTELLEFFTCRRYLEAMTFHRETEAVRNFILDFFDFIAVELDDLIAVLADNMIMVWMLGVIGIVEFVVFAEIHLAQQAALG